MHRIIFLTAIGTMVFVLLVVAACVTEPETPLAPGSERLLGTPVIISDQATQAAALTQEKNAADSQAVATAEIVRDNAQATLYSADATLSAAQTQQKNNADIIAAQVAATVEIVRANAQATLVSAGSTQSAALTQDAIRQTQVQYNFEMTAEQGNRNEIAAGTQTAAADLIATQTQSALATSQWYADQSRQRQEQNRGALAFLWTWCLPVFLVLLAGLIIWGIWRWLKIRQANQRIFENPVEKLPAPAAEDSHHQPDDLFPYIESNVIDSRYQLKKPDEQVHGWLDEVKRKLLNHDKKDEDDVTDD
jgi:hypothetical protein